MKKFFLMIVVLVIIAVSALTYFGFVPYLSPIFAKPKNLGVIVDLTWADDFGKEQGMKNQLPGGFTPLDREPAYSGTVELDVELDSDQISSIVNYLANRYGRSPIRDLQIRINEDGTGEASGILEISTATMMAKQLGYSDQDIETAKS